MMGASIPANGQELRLTRNWQREIQPAGHKGRRGPASAAPNGWDQGIESVGPPGGSLKLRYDAGGPWNTRITRNGCWLSCLWVGRALRARRCRSGFTPRLIEANLAA